MRYVEACNTHCTAPHLLRLLVGNAHQEDANDGADDAEAGNPEGERHAVVDLVDVRSHTLPPQGRQVKTKNIERGKFSPLTP